MANYNITTNREPMNLNLRWDTRQMDAANKAMDATAAGIIAMAIKEVLRAEISPTQSQIFRDTPPSQRDMATAVADSLTVEAGHRDKTAEVRFGSDPMDSGGVTGSRGGKLAEYLEFGVDPFEYGFTFKTIKNSRFWGAGGTSSGGFINAKGGNMTHKGFKAIGWLSQAQERAVPKMESAILNALNEAWS
jgi:hypothetical protein